MGFDVRLNMWIASVDVTSENLLRHTASLSSPPTGGAEIAWIEKFWKAQYSNSFKKHTLSAALEACELYTYSIGVVW